LAARRACTAGDQSPQNRFPRRQPGIVFGSHRSFSERAPGAWLRGGRNIVIEYRWTEGKPERMRELAEELVRLKVDVIIAPSSVYTEAAKRATATIPIIFLVHADPVGGGDVASLARPGGNITGL